MRGGAGAAALVSVSSSPVGGRPRWGAVLLLLLPLLLLLLLHGAQTLQVVAAEKAAAGATHEDAAKELLLVERTDSQGGHLESASSVSTLKESGIGASVSLGGPRAQQYELPSEAKLNTFAAAAAAPTSTEAAAAPGAPGAPQARGPPFQAAAPKGGPSNTGGPLSTVQRYGGFSGRPSCPSKNPQAEERRRRAAAAAGAALLQSQMQQQQRWLLLQSRKQQAAEAVQQQQLQQPQQTAAAGMKQEQVSAPPSSGLPPEQMAGEKVKDVILPAASAAAAAAAAAAGGSGSLAATKSEQETAQGAPKAAAPPSCPLPSEVSPFFHTQLDEALGPAVGPHTIQVGGDSLLETVHAGVYTETPQETRHSFSRSAVASAETRVRMQPRMQQESPKEAEAPPFRMLWGGLEAIAEEGELRGPHISSQASVWGLESGLHGHAQAHASSLEAERRQGAAVGLGEAPELTWVMGAPYQPSSSLHSSPSQVHAALKESLELAFRVHAQELHLERSFLGLSAPSVHAGAPYAATLQFSFDVVPLHEQRLIQAEAAGGPPQDPLGLLGPLGPPEAPVFELVGELMGAPFAADFFEALEEGTKATPAQVQLSGWGFEDVSLIEGGVSLHARGHAEQWMRSLLLPEELVQLQLLALTLQELRLLLALEEEMGGPQAPLPTEDWAPEDREERMHFLWPPQELHAQHARDRQYQRQRKQQQQQQQEQQQQEQQQQEQLQEGEETEEDYLLDEEEEAFWELMLADPDAW